MKVALKLKTFLVMLISAISLSVIIRLFNETRLQIKDAPASAEEVHTVKETEHNPSQNKENVLDPLEDYETYPCVRGIPPFPEDTWSSGSGKCVRTICATENINKTSDSLCVPLQILDGTTPICTYPASFDHIISARLQKAGHWERQYVNNMAKYFMSHTDVLFLDLGCNIGTYSLSMAHLGIKVTAVDPVIANLQLLLRSAMLGGFQDNVTLIWNAISNKRNLVTFQEWEGNVGGTKVIPVSVKQGSNQARTITLGDLTLLFKGKRVVIKMDIEGFEYMAFMGAGKFFEEVDVVVIQMEWKFFRNPGIRSITETGIKIVDFFSSKKLYPFLDIKGANPLTVQNTLRWPADIYFLKRNNA